MDTNNTTMPEDKRKLYNCMDNVINYINGNFIALPNKEITRNNIILSVITNEIIKRMKKTSPLFAALYKEIYHGGSFYDHLKVGKPNEYDLDLILVLPQITNPVLYTYIDQPGFVSVKVIDYEKIPQESAEERAKFKEFLSLLASNMFLSSTKVQSWFEGVFAKVYCNFQKEEKGTYFGVSLYANKPEDVTRIYIRVIKEGPAFTLKMTGEEMDNSVIQLDIDLVPCFRFNGNQYWPKQSHGYLPNPCSAKSSFLVVPKKPKYKSMDKSFLERYWRLSFQDQERELLGHDKQALKPCLRILKKLKDTHKHDICSYFIKTIFLWAVREKHVKFWSLPKAFVIITMLKKYEEHLQERKISYYWNEKYNLIEYLNKDTCKGLANQLKKIISEVEIGLKDPIDIYVIGKSLLTTKQYERLKLEVPLSKKQGKRIKNSKIKIVLNTSHYTTDTSDSAPPLLRLDFDHSDVSRIQKYSDTLDKNRKSRYEEMVHIQEATKNSSEGIEVIAYLQKIG